MIVGIALFAAAMFGQQVRTFYTTADGLPSDDVSRVATTADGTVLAQTSKGTARFEKGRWTAVSEALPSAREYKLPNREGLPVDSITALAQADDGSFWVGTTMGAIRYDGKVFEYRQGLRWLPDDQVRSIATSGNEAFFATAKGVGVIETTPMTFAKKAKFFEDEIDARHRRTEYGYVLGVQVQKAGDKGSWTQSDSDNDGLWTAMYGAGQCFACAAQVEGACERAKKAFEALRFLGTVTQGGTPPAPRGYVARTVLPVSGPDPNATYTPERDEQFRNTRDSLWKVMRPRWPKSADGKWYWKADTSSDELDGHYFFYGLYYDLVAKSAEEKQRVRDHVAALTDHMVEHGFRLVDHDGKPTRWGYFNPEALNRDPMWYEERGLNSISMLSYLKTAEHITGGQRFADASRLLREKHGYDMNTLIPKDGRGPGAGNQSDDEMAFMCLYNLLRYEKDPKLRAIYGLSLKNRWDNESPELNPLFNYIAAVSLKGLEHVDSHGRESLEPSGEWRAESLDTLRRYPLDRFNWSVKNSHRKDLVPLRTGGGRGHTRDGKVLPIDERFVEHWNHDPWRLDYAGNGRRLADGASFLLPYYMGLHYRLLEE